MKRRAFQHALRRRCEHALPSLRCVVRMWSGKPNNGQQTPRTLRRMLAHVSVQRCDHNAQAATGSKAPRLQAAFMRPTAHGA